MTRLKIDLIADNLISIHPLLDNSIFKPIKHQSSVTPVGMFVIGSLKRNGTQSMSDIGKCLSMPRPHVTVIVDKLIDEGLVERRKDPNDRRIINILLTESGVAVFENIKLEINENLKIKLSKLNEEEQEILADASQKVREILSPILSK
jgi:DNA-binding MarR family transcriptional regulator